MASGIGVFVCDCKGQVSNHLDTARVAEQASAMEAVAFVDRVDVLCSKSDLGAAIRKVKDSGCDRLLFAGCSPRSSLSFPEERIATVMHAVGLQPDLFEVANIREQCAWQHPDRDAATGKAIDLVRMAHARLVSDEPADRPVPIAKAALVVGAGAAGLQAAKDLASAGIDVTIAERNPWLGGHVCQVHRLFQSEGWPSVCDASCVGPVQAKGAVLSERIRTLTLTSVTAVQKANGNFRVTLEGDPLYVDADLCISCGECARVCPEQAERRYDHGFTKRRAIDKEFERAVPDTFSILPDICTKCGECVSACPTNAIDLEAEERTITEDFGAVFLATGFDQIDLSGYPEYLSTHPNVVTSLEFERMLEGGVKRPSDGEEPESVVFVQCAGSRAGADKQADGVEYCSKTCCSVTAKQVDRLMSSNPMVEPFVVYYRDMRTYERALEGLYQKTKNAGVDFVNGEVTAISEKNGGLELTIDPTCLDENEDPPPPRELEGDLVVLAAAQTPAHGSRDLCGLFGVETDRYGYPVENQPRLFRPTESLVDRVYVIGASSGPKVVQQASEQGSAAAMRALPSLLGGEKEPPRYASRVNPDRCVRCGLCVAICPHGAITLTADGALSDPAFCQACGLCAAACPAHAVELNNFTDEQLLAQVGVAFDNLKAGEPKLLALLCYWCSYSAADFAGVERATAPPNYRAIRIRCSSSVNTALLMRMFRMGVDGILVGGCPERSCHHLHGNFVADKRIELARALLAQLGLDQSRLRFEYIGAPMQGKLLETLELMNEKLRALGPNPAAVTAVRGG